MAMFLTFTILPILMTIGLSLFNFNPMRSGMQFLGIGNFRELALGLAIQSLSHKGLRDTFRTMYFVPVVTPVVAGAIIWKMIMNPGFGLITTVLHMIILVVPVIITFLLFQRQFREGLTLSGIK